MTNDPRHIVTTGLLVRAARDLKSEDGENPEYDRALVELVAAARGLSSDDYPQVARDIGILPAEEWFSVLATILVKTTSVDEAEIEADNALTLGVESNFIEDFKILWADAGERGVVT